MTCPACGGHEAKFTGRLGLTTYLNCRRCGQAFRIPTYLIKEGDDVDGIPGPTDPYAL